MDFQTLSGIERAYRERGVSQVVSPNDQMFKSGPDWYDSVGLSGLQVVLSCLATSWLPRVGRILDLPCGHGRVARHLRAAFPDAQMFFCDLETDGVDFCAETFGGERIYSRPELSEVALPRDLDLIWIGSLFTHVDEKRTARWLSHLAAHLGEHGVLVATFHGLFAAKLQETHPMIDAASWKKIVKGYERTGFGYAPYTELDMGDYGISLSRPSRIVDMATAIEGTRMLAYQERGWANNHDVLALTRNDRYRAF